MSDQCTDHGTYSKDDKKCSFVHCLTPELKVVRYLETSVTVYQTTHLYILEDLSLRRYRCEKLKSRNSVNFWFPQKAGNFLPSRTGVAELQGIMLLVVKMK
jgi:hypothetical protein